MSSTFVGPLSFVVLAVPADADLGEVIDQVVVQLERADTIAVLDIELLARADDGAVHRLAMDHELAVASETDLLDDDDLAEIGADLATGEAALVIVYEDHSLGGVARRVADLGGREVWSGGIDATDLDDDQPEDQGAES